MNVGRRPIDYDHYKKLAADMRKAERAQFMTAAAGGMARGPCRLWRWILSGKGEETREALDAVATPITARPSLLRTFVPVTAIRSWCRTCLQAR